MEDILEALVAARLDSFLEDMRAEQMLITEPNIMIMVEIVEIMHPVMDFEYLLETLVIQELRNLIERPSVLN